LSSQLRTRSTRTPRPIEFRAELVKTIPVGQVADTHELSDVITFLATAAGYVNGAVIHVDGGRTSPSSAQRRALPGPVRSEEPLTRPGSMSNER
jgi:NAD(P)-dependent dehydrogenase (short-subunit alcohol dehydrogenase family)